MPNPMQIKMEDMSIAYVRALCAFNGYSVESVTHDNDGYDLSIICKGYPAEDCKRMSPRVLVQLKSSYARINQINENTISYQLEVKNYNDLINNDRCEPIILIVLHMFEDEFQWIEQTKDFLKITKCAYWKSLKGRALTNNKESIAIQLSDDDLLTADSLRKIMIKVANEQDL